MTDAERKAAFLKERAAQLRIRAALLATTREEVIAMLNEALDEIKALLATAPTEYEQYKLPLLQKQIEQTLVIFQNNAADVLAQGATQAWADGQALATMPLEAAGIAVTNSLPPLDTAMLMAMSSFMTNRIQDVGAQAISRINAQLGLVMIGAESPGEAVSTITDILGEESRERAITIMRTELGRVHAVAAQQRMEQAAKYVPGMGKQWRRSGKIHSRENHDAIDGQIQLVEKPFALVAKDGTDLFMMHPHDPTAPAGEVINCGCVSIPHMTSWKVLNPGRMPYSQLELQNNPLKREINDAINSAKLTEAFDPGQPRDAHGRWMGVSTHAEIFAFLGGTGGKPIVVAKVPLDIKAKLGANTDHVLLSRYTADKQKKHPEITAASYGKLQHLLDHGERLYDTKHHVTVIHHSSNPHVAVLKATQSGHEVYLQSFRRSDAGNVASLKKRAGDG
jgi:hypothetical protein